MKKTVPTLIGALGFLLAAFVLYRGLSAKKTKQPQKVLSVASFRYKANTGAMAGQACILKGVYIQKVSEGNRSFILLRDPSDSMQHIPPVKCYVHKDAAAWFHSIELQSELVLSGQVTMAGQEAAIEEASVISQSSPQQANNF
jgi:aspartyl/asparaginyl-tRNA synthetase